MRQASIKTIFNAYVSRRSVATILHQDFVLDRVAHFDRIGRQLVEPHFQLRPANRLWWRYGAGRRGLEIGLRRRRERRWVDGGQHRWRWRANAVDPVDGCRTAAHIDAWASAGARLCGADHRHIDGRRAGGRIGRGHLNARPPLGVGHHFGRLASVVTEPRGVRVLHFVANNPAGKWRPVGLASEERR